MKLMMPLRKLIIAAFLLILAACLALGFAAAAPWMALAAVLVCMLSWVSSWKWPLIWPPTAALVISTGVAAAGLLAGASPWPVLLSGLPTLALWDLILLDQALAESSPASSPARSPASSPRKMPGLLEQKHFQSLALALGLGLCATVAVRLIQIQIPFGILVLLAILAFFSLDRVWHSIR